MRLRWLGLATLMFSLACFGGRDVADSGPLPEGDADTDVDSDSDADADSDTDADPAEAPEILEFSVNPTSLEEREDADFFALVTDPQGISDLIGGSLKVDGATIAAFQTSADEGSYSTTVDFDTLADAYGQDAGGSTGILTVTASFTDQGGHTAIETLAMELTCDGGEHLCEDGCTDISGDPDNCGGCGDTCDDAIEASGLNAPHEAVEGCLDQDCVGMAECVPPDEVPDATCDEICADYGANCVGALIYSGESCSAYYHWDTSDQMCDWNMRTWLIEDFSARCTCAL